MPQQLVFFAFAALMVVCSVMVIASRNPVTSAIFLVGDLFLMAGMFAMMEDHFVAAIQVLVYAGAIVILFVFVIMLLNLSPDSRDSLRIPAPELGVLILTVVGFLVIGIMLGTEQPPSSVGEMTAGGNTYASGMMLFTRYLWPFELSSILILLAVIASVVIAKKDKPADGKAAGILGKPGMPTNKRRAAHGTR